MRVQIRQLAWLLLLAPACAAQRVQLYEGEKLPDDQVTILYSNPHLEMGIDRQYNMPEGEVSKLHRIELPPGNHAVEVHCLYDDPKYKRSPLIPVLLDGEAGHVYKARVQYGKSDDGLPKCKVKIFDLTAESGGEKTDTY
jgi:hypothetical protein